MHSNGTTVAVGMSGGVDSSLAAALLKRQGYMVIGLAMEIYGGEPLSGEVKGHACYGPGEEEDVRLAAEVAAFLGIPFHTVDLRDKYRQFVLEHFKEEYLAGRTPNPCTRCNPMMKFGFLIERARKSGIHFDKFATGHYVRTCHDGQRGRHVLKKALDHKKDQSYFLYGLPAALLPRLMFPLGGMNKNEVRALAHEIELPVCAREESQDFIEGGEYADLFTETPLPPGPIVDQAGKRLGTHRGIIHYTIGQRKGLGIAHHAPLYVTGIDAATNSIIAGPKTNLFSDGLVAKQINLLSTDSLACDQHAQVKIRHNHTAAPATVTTVGDDTITLLFDEPQLSVTPGQAAVLYDGDIVLGGGVIEKGIKKA